MILFNLFSTIAFIVYDRSDVRQNKVGVYELITCGEGPAFGCLLDCFLTSMCRIKNQLLFFFITQESASMARVVLFYLLCTEGSSLDSLDIIF